MSVSATPLTLRPPASGPAGRCSPISGRFYLLTAWWKGPVVPASRDQRPWARAHAEGSVETVGKRIIVLGGGTGGTLLANRLRRLLDRDADIVVIDSDDEHVYQPGLLFVPFGMAAPARLVRPRHRQLRPDHLYVTGR
jgi:hypothetical protein